ncbi:MAG: bifunctional DNA primase/polymerase, partial [Candidatus Dojkabacteria bacterium]
MDYGKGVESFKMLNKQLTAEEIELVNYYKHLNQQYSMIPLNGISKIPKDKNWQQASESHRTIHDNELLNTNEDVSNLNNVGISTGKASKLIVLDVDDHQKFEMFALNNDIDTSDLKNTFTVQTKRGHHYYFIYPGGPGSYPSRSLPKVFDIRSDKGMVLAPGSIHPKDKSVRYLVVNNSKPLPCPE